MPWSLTFFFFVIGPASRLKLPFIEKVVLEDGAVLEDEAASCVLGYLFGGAGIVQDNAGKNTVRSAAHPKIQVVLGLAGDDVSVRVGTPRRRKQGAVCSRGQYGGPCHIGGDTVVPEEDLQVHIAGVGDGEIIPHGTAGQQRGVAPFGKGWRACRAHDPRQE